MMKRFWPLLLSAFFLAACGPLPITIDLMPSLQQNGYDRGSATQTVAVPPGAQLSDQDLKVPDANGYRFTFEVPNLPASPASLVFDYQATLDYQLACIDNLGGTLNAQVYLAGDAAQLWQSPLDGAQVSAPVKSQDTLTLKGSARLSQAQLDAVLNGSLVLGVELKTQGLTGQASIDPACQQNGQTQVKFSGQYQIQKAVVEVRFF